MKFVHIQRYFRKDPRNTPNRPDGKEVKRFLVEEDAILKKNTTSVLVA